MLYLGFMSPVYSVLCESDPVVYAKYLRACVLESYVELSRSGVVGFDGWCTRGELGCESARVVASVEEGCDVDRWTERKESMCDCCLGDKHEEDASRESRCTSSGVGGSEVKSDVGSSGVDSADERICDGLRGDKCEYGGFGGTVYNVVKGESGLKVGKWSKKNKKKRDAKKAKSLRKEGEDGKSFEPGSLSSTEGSTEGVDAPVWRRKQESSSQARSSLKGKVDDDTSRWRRSSKVVKSVGLQESLERKWAAENALAEEKAKQQLELLQARDLEKVKCMQRAQVMRTTEVCKVQTEKAFGTLKRTGNVPGFAETVVSDSSLTDGSTARSSGDCISPDSSVSQQEIRKMQQDLLDYEHMLKKVKEANPLLYDHVKRIGPLKTAFTLESDGGIPVEEFGEIRDDGKFHVAYPSADIITNKERAKLEALGDLHFPGADDHEYLLGQAGGF